jgi:hypothetical protein
MRQTEPRDYRSAKPKVQECKKINVAIRGGKAQRVGPGSGRSVAWLARLFRVQEVVSSNLTAPTTFRFQPFVQNVATCRVTAVF